MAQETIIQTCYYCRKPVNGGRVTITRKGKTFIYCGDAHALQHLKEIADYEKESNQNSLF